MKVNFAPANYSRGVADAADLVLENRYFEENPSLSDDGASLIARPGMKFLKTVGNGPITAVASEPGIFGGDLFVVSGGTLFRMNNRLDVTTIDTGLSDPDHGTVNFAFVQAIGSVAECLFFADGRNLKVYVGGEVKASGVLTASGAISSGDDVVVGSINYAWTSGDVDSGSPDGTSGNPWLVALGSDDAGSIENLFYAINATGTPGTTYSTALAAHDEVDAVAFTATTITIKASFAGAAGNSIATTETGANLAWGAATMAGGAGNTVSTVATPDDIGIFDVATIASYVVCVPTQINEFIGRFYWIEPGETTIDPLNFATAESHPDRILGVSVAGDQFWLPGEKRTEVWYPTGDPATPMVRLKGAVFDKGTWEATSLAIDNVLMIVDADGSVYANQTPVSDPGLAELIREAIQLQQNFIL